MNELKGKLKVEYIIIKKKTPKEKPLNNKKPQSATAPRGSIGTKKEN